MLRLEDQRSRRPHGAGSCDMAQALIKRIDRGLATRLKPRAYTLDRRLEFSQVAQIDTHGRMACEPHSRGQQ